MDALMLLNGDHNRVRGLFKRFEDAHERDDERSMTLLGSKIIEDLVVHTTIEEQIFYPAVRDLSDEIEELVAEGLQEHHVAKQLIEESQSIQPGGEEWTAKMTVLIENVEHHAEEEEGEMFPK